jgi:hypothetical protein
VMTAADFRLYFMTPRMRQGACPQGERAINFS